MNRLLKRLFFLLFLTSMVLMLGCYLEQYANAIPWEVTTTAEVDEVIATTVIDPLYNYPIKGEVYKLKEQYTGGSYKEAHDINLYFTIGIWLALCIALVGVSYLRRYGFIAFLALLGFFLHNLSLHEISFFGSTNRLIMLIPMGSLSGILLYFNEFNPKTPLWVRFSSMIVLLIICSLGISDLTLFTLHQAANSTFSLALIFLLFLFMISEEIIFTLLKLITTGKGGKSNHLHFSILSLIYLTNIILYFLNKAGYFANEFFFFDPFFLLVISSVVAWWNFSQKKKITSNLFPNDALLLLLMGLGTLAFLFVSQAMYNGNDAIYESMHYFIIYFHIGFGFFFLSYIIFNFIDPLMDGVEVYRIAYQERNFPYITSKLGALIVVIGLYLLSNQESFKLLQSGNYTRLAQKSHFEKNHLLSKEYLIEATKYGFNIHKPNYELGKIALAENKEYAAKVYFEKASKRFGSAQSLINYGNLAATIDRTKTEALYEEKLRESAIGEIENNLGLLHLENKEYQKAHELFKSSESSDDWNNAPAINKWYTSILNGNLLDSASAELDWSNGNYGVKANMLLATQWNDDLKIDVKNIKLAKSLHRQSFLLNAAYKGNNDSIAYYIKNEIANSSNGTINNRLRRALAVHYFKSGEINKSLQTLDELQANDFTIKKGQHLADMGKICLSQNAPRLAEKYFNDALEQKIPEAYLGKASALLAQQKTVAIPDILLQLIQQDPAYTELANTILEKMDNYSFDEAPIMGNNLTSLTSNNVDSLIAVASKNAFDEQIILRVTERLKELEASGGYELLIAAIEINPYSEELLKAYVLSALDWNLLDYAEQTMTRLKKVKSADSYQEFEKVYLKKIESLQNATWQ